MFSTALIHGDIADPNSLWIQFKDQICDDLPHQMQHFPAVPANFESPWLDYRLHLIQKGLADFDRTLASFDLPVPALNWEQLQGNALIATETAYDSDTERQLLHENLSLPNPEQQTCFNTIVTAVDQSPATAHFFLQGPAGTGKTFLYKTLCHHYWSRDAIVLCVASSSIAALLLPGGQTSHTRFKILLICNATSTCSITRGSALAELLRNTSLIIWDEVPLQHKYNFTAVDFTLCDIWIDDSLFGGIPTILGGDFVQTLPIVPKGSRAQQVNASLIQSIIWPQLKVLCLHRNM